MISLFKDVLDATRNGSRDQPLAILATVTSRPSLATALSGTERANSQRTVIGRVSAQNALLGI